MASFVPKLPRSRRSLVVCIPILAILFGVGSSLFQFIKELRALDASTIVGAMTLSEDARVERELARLAVEAGIAAGVEYQLYLLLRAELPDDAVVLLLGKDNHKLTSAGERMKVLLAPRRVGYALSLTSDWREGAKTIGRRGFLVEYGNRSKAPLTDVFERVVNAEHFALWRVKADMK